jgi:tetratricopeptide (TPR) repeat protein
MKQGKFSPALGFLILSLTLTLFCPSGIAATKFEQLNQQAENFYKTRNYPEAEKAFQQALKEAEKLETGDKRVATTVYNLALCQQAQSNYAEAEKNMSKAVDMMTVAYGAEHQRVAQVYMDLADLYLEQAGQENKPELKAKAVENYKKGIDIFEKIYSQATGQEDDASKQDSGPGGKGAKKSAANTTADTAADLSNALRLLADFHAQEENYEQAEPLYKRSLELEEFSTGPETKDMARHKAKLAEFYCVQAKYRAAEPLFKDALAIHEKMDPNSIDTANLLYNYGGLFYDQAMFGDAEVMFKRAIKIFSEDPDQNESDIAQKNIALADVMDRQGKIEDADKIYKKSMVSLEKLEDKSPLIRCLKQYQQHLLMQNKKEEANKVLARIKELKGKSPKAQASQ